MDISLAAVGPVLLDSRSELVEKSFIHRFAIKIPDACLRAHSRISLATFPHTVSLNIGPFINSPPIYFHPGMCLEREFLRSQDHLCRDTVLPQQIGGRK